VRIQTFNYDADVEKALLWQYENATELRDLVARQQYWVNENQRDFWQKWFDTVFNLNTADDFGLAVWSIILGLPLFVEIKPDSPHKAIFGFDPYYKNFNNGVFTSEIQTDITLTIEERRLILKLRYFQMTTRCGLVEVNENLQRIFESKGDVYVIDNYAVGGVDFSIDYYFSYVPSPNFLNVLRIFDILPRPATSKIANIFIP